MLPKCDQNGYIKNRYIIIVGITMAILDLEFTTLFGIFCYKNLQISIQRKIWITSKYKWNDFFTNIGWIINDIPCRYPIDFTWTLQAPKGHLPLFNQLRGMQVLLALFRHTAWK